MYGYPYDTRSRGLPGLGNASDNLGINRATGPYPSESLNTVLRVPPFPVVGDQRLLDSQGRNFAQTKSVYYTPVICSDKYGLVVDENEPVFFLSTPVISEVNEDTFDTEKWHTVIGMYHLNEMLANYALDRDTSLGQIIGEKHNLYTIPNYNNVVGFADLLMKKVRFAGIPEISQNDKDQMGEIVTANTLAPSSGMSFPGRISAVRLVTAGMCDTHLNIESAMYFSDEKETFDVEKFNKLLAPGRPLGIALVCYDPDRPQMNEIFDPSITSEYNQRRSNGVAVHYLFKYVYVLGGQPNETVLTPNRHIFSYTPIAEIFYIPASYKTNVARRTQALKASSSPEYNKLLFRNSNMKTSFLVRLLINY